MLRESLSNWKNEVTETLMAEVEEIKEQKLEELEEANVEYREKQKEEYASKMIAALKEMREELRAEVVTEMYDNNPELSILEQIKELVAPTLNEDFVGNIYAEEIQKLKEKIDTLEEAKSLDEGAKKLAELIAPYSEKTQNILLSLIKEGGPDEVTEQFYSLIENLEEAEDDDEEEKDDIEMSAGEDDDEESEEDDEDDEDDDESEEDEEAEESTDEKLDDTYINEGTEGDEKPEPKKVNSFIAEMKRRSGLS